MSEALDALKKQASKQLATLEKEIAGKQQQLDALRAEAEMVMGVLGKPSGSAKSAKAKTGESGQRTRTDWQPVLDSLPHKFSVKDVLGKLEHTPGNIYVRLGKWVDQKTVKKVGKEYQKL
jgi:hypothetical protein